MSEREDREAFEAAAKAEGFLLDREGWPTYDYKAWETHVAFEIWQAALRYERERARESGNAE